MLWITMTIYLRNISTPTRCVTISVIQVGGTVEERIELAEQFAPSNQGFVQVITWANV